MKAASVVAVLVSLVALAAVAVACQSSIEPGNALLPIGFDETQILDVELSGYVYVNRGSPFRLSVKHFHDQEQLPVEIPAQFNIDRTTVMIGPSLDAFAGMIGFSSSLEADLAWQLLEEKGQATPLWVDRSGSQVSIVRGEDEWSDDIRDAIAEDRRVTLKDQYLKSWETMSILPEDPPSRPIAAGFLRVNRGLLEAAATKAGIELGRVSPALGFMRISNIAFAIYSDDPLQVPERVDEAFIKESGLGAVMIARSGYPGFILSLALNILGGRVGLDKVDLEGTEVRYRALQDLHLLVKNQGSIIYATLAANRATAEALMLSALGQ